MNGMLAQLYSSLDMVVFEHTGDDRFQALTEVPDKLRFFLPLDGDGAGVDLPHVFPYLSCFMDDAHAHWQAQGGKPLTSGSWVEINELDQQVPLEATALWLEGRQILLLQQLGEQYTQHVQHLQHLREGLLTQELLESEVRKHTLQIRKREEDIAIKLVSLTSFRDEETGAHVRRIGLYASVLAKALGWKQTEVDNIRVAAPMHDIGKIGIPDSILRKAGSLNDEEFNLMKQHTVIGFSMLSGTKIPILDMAAEIAHCHHERWDGTGYPQGLQGEDIPLSARITTVVDIYDALVHERVYKKAMPETEALLLMQEMSGHHLDPRLFKIFLYLLPVMQRIRSEVSEDADTSAMAQQAN
ncbi:MAG: HD domain-containing protein [Thiolinea sp.]